MKNPFITPLFFIGALLVCNSDVLAQVTRGISSFTAGAATITFGKTVRSGGSGGSSKRTIEGKHGITKRNCVPGSGICQLGALTSVTVNKSRTPARPYMFYVDSVNCPNLTLLIHTDSISDADYETYNFFHEMKNGNPATSQLGGLTDQYPGIAAAFSLPAEYSFTLDSASCKTIGINTDANGLYIPPNTLCLISQPTADTNYFMIRFLGSMNNRISLKMGDPNNNCDTFNLGICDILPANSNSNYAFYDAVYYGNGSMAVYFYVNRSNIGFEYPFINDMGWPGTIGLSQNIDFNNYPFLTNLQGWYLADANAGMGTVLPAGWCVYSFVAINTPPVSDGGDK